MAYNDAAPIFDFLSEVEGNKESAKDEKKRKKHKADALISAPIEQGRLD